MFRNKVCLTQFSSMLSLTDSHVFVHHCSRSSKEAESVASTVKQLQRKPKSPRVILKESEIASSLMAKFFLLYLLV